MIKAIQHHQVSVIIPFFNGGAWIAQTLASLFTGNGDSIVEVVVADDGSDSQNRSLLGEAVSHFPKIKIIRLNENRGGAAARNIAVANTTADWIFCLDSDNLATPGLMSALHSHALANDLDACTPEFSVFFDEDPTKPSHAWQYRQGPLRLIDHFACAYVPSASGNYLFRRDSFEKARGYPEFSRSLDTWGFGLRQVATGSRISCAPGTHYLHRYGHDSYWVRESKKENVSLTATSIALPFSSQFPKGLLKKMLGRHRNDWFERIHKHPLVRASGEPAGRLLGQSETLRLLNNQ